MGGEAQGVIKISTDAEIGRCDSLLPTLHYLHLLLNVFQILQKPLVFNSQLLGFAVLRSTAVAISLRSHGSALHSKAPKGQEGWIATCGLVSPRRAGILTCSQHAGLISPHLAACELEPALHLQEQTPGRFQLQPRLPPSTRCTRLWPHKAFLSGGTVGMVP